MMEGMDFEESDEFDPEYCCLEEINEALGRMKKLES